MFFIMNDTRTTVLLSFCMLSPSLFVKVKLVVLASALYLARVGVLKIALDNVVSVLTDGAQTSLLHDGSNNGSRKGIVADDERVEIDFGGEAHLGGNRGEDEATFAAVSQRGELDLAIQTTGTQQRRIQSVRTVCRHDDLDVGSLVETVHLVEQLQQNTLDFTIGTSLGIETLGGDGVNLIDENNGWRVLAGHTEDVADHARAFTKVLLHKLGAHDADEAGCRRVGDGLDQHGLAGTGRAV